MNTLIRSTARMGTSVRRAVRAVAAATLGLSAVIALSTSPLNVEAQEPISLADFDGWRDWPLYAPGDLEIDSEALVSHRTWMKFIAPSGDTMTQHVDLTTEARFNGEPAIWVQHTGSGTLGDPETQTSVIDWMIVNRMTFRVLFRIGGAPGERTWAGRYDLTQHYPDHVVRTTVNDDASVSQNRANIDNNPFDFVTMPYVVALSGLLREGERFRLMNIGSANDPAPRSVGLFVKGKTTIEDGNGVRRDVWDVQLISNSERLLVHLYVSEDLPYFMGWRFRSVANGRDGVINLYRSHRLLEERR